MDSSDNANDHPHKPEIVEKGKGVHDKVEYINSVVLEPDSNDKPGVHHEQLQLTDMNEIYPIDGDESTMLRLIIDKQGFISKRKTRCSTPNYTY